PCNAFLSVQSPETHSNGASVAALPNAASEGGRPLTSLSITATRWPCARKRLAVAAPMPAPPPVMATMREGSGVKGAVTGLEEEVIGLVVGASPINSDGGAGDVGGVGSA